MGVVQYLQGQPKNVIEIWTKTNLKTNPWKIYTQSNLPICLV